MRDTVTDAVELLGFANHASNGQTPPPRMDNCKFELVPGENVSYQKGEERPFDSETRLERITEKSETSGRDVRLESTNVNIPSPYLWTPIVRPGDIARALEFDMLIVVRRPESRVWKVEALRNAMLAPHFAIPA